MAKASTFPGEHVRELVVYRRLSGFAIMSLAVAGAYAIVIVIGTLLALRDRSPLLIPPWAHAVPIVPAVLSLMAMYFIRNSEGALAGMKLAVWAWWLSVIFGLGYEAYYAATYFAVTQQAQTFGLKWLNKLKEGQLAEAFLDTQDPADRKKFNPGDLERINIQFMLKMGPPKDGVMRPPLDLFRENKLVHMMEQGGSSTQIEPLAIKGWDFKSGGYQVRVVYKVTTEEATQEVGMTVVDTESKSHEYEGRQRQVIFGEVRVENPRSTEVGILLSQWRGDSMKFLDAWGQRLSAGDFLSTYEGTIEPAERKGLEHRLYCSLLLAGLRAGSVQGQGVPCGPAGGCSPWLGFELAFLKHKPEAFELLQRKKFVNGDKLLTDEKASFHAAREGLEGIFGGRPNRPRLVQVQVNPDSVRRFWKIDKDRVRLTHDCKISFGNPPKGYSVETTITTESDPGPLDPKRHPNFRVVGIELITASNRANEGGPMKMPMSSMAEMMRGGMGQGPPPTPEKGKAP